MELPIWVVVVLMHLVATVAVVVLFITMGTAEVWVAMPQLMDEAVAVREMEVLVEAEQLS
jgi:hypothetical protein